MDIINLKNKPEHLAALAAWHHAEWAHINAGDSLEGRIEKMQLYLSDDAIPSTFIGLDQNQLVGSVAIIEHDMDTHKELSPWLASVFVHPDFRNRGFGAELVLHAMQYIREIGFRELYLFTEGKKEFYANLGWEVWSEEPYRNIDVTIMKATLSD